MVEEIKNRVISYIEAKKCDEILSEYTRRYEECYRRSPSIINEAQKDFILDESKRHVNNKVFYRIFNRIAADYIPK